MDKKLYSEATLAISEFYSWQELQNEEFMRAEVQGLLGLKGKEAALVIHAARRLNRLWKGRIPKWKLLLIVH